MQTRHVETTNRFLAELVHGGDFAAIPIADDVRVRGPLVAADGARTYRAICRDLADEVRGIELRDRVGLDDVVHLVYDIDMGLADGPLATSHTIRFDGDDMVDVEVIFDAARVTDRVAGRVAGGAS